MAALPGNNRRRYGLDACRSKGQQGFMTDQPSPDPIVTTMLSLAAERGPEASFCPSEVARALAGKHPDQWGKLMQPVRRIAVQLATEGRLVILRKGRPADPQAFKGVYRLTMPRLD
jgi:hypothetical protein